LKECITMRYTNVALAALLGMTAASALARAQSGPDSATGARPGHQVGIGESLPLSDKASNIMPADTRSDIAPTLPQSGIGANGASRDYLKSARDSLMHGRTGQAQQSLEMAETRALDRSVPEGRTGQASNSQFVARIEDARHALGRGDRGNAIKLIDLALST
jgi:hypothetical protein